MKALSLFIVISFLCSCTDSSKLEGKWELFRMKDEEGNVFYSTIAEERKQLDKASVMPVRIAEKYDESFGKIQFSFANGKSQMLEKGNPKPSTELDYKLDEKHRKIITTDLTNVQKSLNYTLNSDTLELRFDGLWLVLRRI